MKPSVSTPILLVGLPFLFGLWGCSAVIALSQYSERTVAHVIADNESRAEVEGKLGTPATTMVFDDGTSISTYEEKIYSYSRFWKDPPGLRAFLYVLYDVTTFGLAEVPFTALEASGKIVRATEQITDEVTVTYDAAGCVVWMSRKRVGN